MQKLHQQAKDALEVYRHEHQEQTDALIAFLGQIVRDWYTHDTSDQRLAALIERLAWMSWNCCVPPRPVPMRPSSRR
jgi:hypothetical protein